MRTSAPSSVDGIGKYQGSGTVRYIGSVYACKLIRAFGEKFLDIIKAEPEPPRRRRRPPPSRAEGLASGRENVYR